MTDPTTLSANWNFPARIRFGAGRIAGLPKACRTLGMARPLLVTDSGLAESTMVRRAVEANVADGVATEVFSEIKSNPVGANIDAGVAAYKSGGHDGIIAFGGGSALDAGKAIALMVGQSEPIWTYEDGGDGWRTANADGIAPIVAVPTTAGTGSETGRASVITDEARESKRIIFHPRMMPGIVISDPELTIGLPQKLTAATGMDALAHNLEALCATGVHPMADGIAVEGIRLVREYLPRAYAQGDDIEARAYMLAAAAMGSTAFQKGLGAIHALSHPIGALYDTHHGMTNAVLMPYVLSFNRPEIEERMSRLAAYLGLKSNRFSAVYEWVLELREALKIPDSLIEIGVDDRQADKVSRMAADDPSCPTNPVPLTAAELKKIFVAAVEGGH